MVSWAIAPLRAACIFIWVAAGARALPAAAFLLNQRHSAGRNLSAMGKPGWKGTGPRPAGPQLGGKGLHGGAARMPPRERTSALAQYLVQQCMWGLMSPQQIQTIASLAMSDIQTFGCAEGLETSSELTRLANLGSKGLYPSNCWRDLNLALTDSKLPKGKTLTLPTQTNTTGVYKDLNFDILLPHEFASALHDHYANHFKEHVCPGRESCEAFWRDMADHPCMEGHPIKGVPGWQSITVPICMFTDGVPVKGVGKS